MRSMISVIFQSKIEYNHQGNLLSLLSDNIIWIYSHWELKEIYSIRSKGKQVQIESKLNEETISFCFFFQFRLMHWSHDDTYLLTIDSNEFITRWNSIDGQILSQVEWESIEFDRNLFNLIFF